MLRPRLIALYSPIMQSGKTTVANTLVNECGFALVKFAQPFKDFIVQVLSNAGASKELAERMVEDGALKEQAIPALGVSTRRLMQDLGSWGRSVHEDFWVEQALPKIKRHMQAGTSVVVDDLRFQNEYDAVLKAGGLPVRVIRPGGAPYTAHASEGLLDGLPMAELHNNGSLDQLRACARELPGLSR